MDRSLLFIIVIPVGLAIGLAGMIVPLLVESIPWWIYFAGAAFFPLIGWIEKQIAGRFDAESDRGPATLSR